MRKPPIILLLSVALTAGAPLAAEAAGWGAVARNEDSALWNKAQIAFGASKEKAEQQALAKCNQATDGRCYVWGAFSPDQVRQYEFGGEQMGPDCILSRGSYFSTGGTSFYPTRAELDAAVRKDNIAKTFFNVCVSEVMADAASQQAPEAAGAYGAFAIDESAWAFAFSVLYPSQAEADQQAVSLCAEEGGEHCEIKYQFTDSRCGAAVVAEEQGLRAWGFGHADARRDAIDNAMSYCKRENTSGGTCRKVAVACGEAEAPQAADEGEKAPYYYGAIQWGAVNVMIRGEKYPGTGKPNDDRYGISVGKTSQEAARQEAKAKCRQAGADDCFGDWLWDINTEPPAEHHTHWETEISSIRCVALVSDGPNNLIRPLVKRAGSKEEAINKSKQACEAGGYNCQLNVAACADDGVTQMADADDDGQRYGAFAIDVSAWAFAFAGGEPSQAEADREALAECAQEGGASCEIKYQFTNRCAAVAVAEEQGLRAWGFGEAEGKAGAIDAAMSYCKRENASGGACHIEAASCGGDLADGAPQEEADAPRGDGATQAADADSAFGAFAIDVSAWAFAFSGGRPSQAEADEHAVSLCAQEGGASCEIKYQFTNRCAAVAVAEEQGLRAWGFGEAEGKAGAIDAAMSYCKRENASGGACHIEAASCGERL